MQPFLSQKVNEKVIFTDTVSESSYFELLGDGKYGLFLNLKVDGKIIFSGY